ncbi:hypothetical protein TGAM01_v207643 [Trichoderma gamsii]|uniref:Uncharacterized protein n=1 Tax=Trichoderma gamsii TaxID=398673 RepID=A0A2P4ZGJ4_9HYPO|nr:hypothetical protein TGAM01_v207643 [Trichoderma gamsii]PON23409.1 hypothetical protein TGAM01_v207643 [Trichoderma gamsii]
MHFSKLLPCIIAFSTPVFSQGEILWAKFCTEKNMQGHSFDLGANDVGRRCVTLQGAVYRNVKSIKTPKAEPIVPPHLEVRCSLYSQVF